jgi:hypothetical protein
MARKCASAAILETLRDPRVVTLPAAAQTVWIRIVTAMQGSSISVLGFGSEIMNRTGIALFSAIAESEIETHLETIIDRGLLMRRADGAVMCPMLVNAAARSEINRINGSKGGRPRKNGEPPGQRSLILPINGGKMETEKTETDTESLSERAAEASSILSNQDNRSDKITVSETEFREVGEAVLAAMEIDPARSYLDYGLVRQWLADGSDRETILEVVKRLSAAARGKGQKITTLKYFTRAIWEAKAAQPAKKPAWEKEYDRQQAYYELMCGTVPRPNLAEIKAKFAA